jgi:hypothetical protein
VSGAEEGFAARWSRRKRAAAEVRRAAVPPHPAALPQEQGEPAENPLASRQGDGGGAGRGRAALPPPDLPAPDLSAPELPAPELPAPELPAPELPAIETLTAASDIRAFMQANVPAALRRAALARIWSLDPAIRDFREMADYDWDFNTPGGAPGFGPLEATEEQLETLLARVFPPPPPEPPAADPAPEPPTPPVHLAAPGPGAPMPEPPAPEPPTHESSTRPRRHGSAIPS